MWVEVAWELIQLQRRYSQFLEKQMLPKSGIRAFQWDVGSSKMWRVLSVDSNTEEFSVN